MSSVDYRYTSLLLKYLDGIQNEECKYHTTNLERFKNTKKQFLAYKHDIEIRHREIDLDIVELITDRYHILNLNLKLEFSKGSGIMTSTLVLSS